MNRISYILFIFFIFFIVQAIGGFFQIIDYQKAVKRLHKIGNIGIGQKKGGFFSGGLVIISCNNSGLITGGEIMKGRTCLARFKPIDVFLGKTLIGSSIYDYLDMLNDLSTKESQSYSGHIHALRALETRLRSF